jgi:hypothetical protein
MSRVAVVVAALALSLAALSAPSRAEAQPIRLLAGIGAEGGVLLDHTEGAIGGLGAHLGVHILGFELYALTQGFVGALTDGPHQGSMQGLSWTSAMLGFGAGPFHLAAGPSLDFAWGCRDANGGSRCFDSSGDPLAGIDARAALVFGNFSISVDAHPTFYRSNVVTGIVLGLGASL